MTRATGDKREAILDAALELFAERGFHGTAVPQIAERAEVGAGTIYRYFDSKEALVNVLYQHWKQRTIDAIVDGFPFDRPLREQFRTLWRRWAAFVIENPRVAQFLELHHHAPYLDATSRAVEESMYGLVNAAIAQAQQQGILREAPAELLIAVIHGVFVGMVRAHTDGRLALTPERVDLVETCCWEAIRA